MRRISICAGLCILAVWLFGATIWGQVTSSTVSGSVRDKTGAIIPGAQITAKDTDTGSSRSASSDSAGRYVIPQLEPGHYTISATTSGFSRQDQNGVMLTVGHTSVVDFTLEVGTVEQTVEVSASAPVVDTTTASLAALVDRQQVEDLPLNGRSFTQLATLQAGVATVTNANKDSLFGGYGIKMSVAGSRQDANLFLLDGIDVNDQYNKTPGSVAGSMLGVDTVREFQVLTSNYGAQFGRVSGGIINAVTRSGTNALHGTIFEYLRNSALDARNFFDRGTSPPPFKRNQFGGTADGPIIRDKAFFLFSYEGLRQRLSETFIYSVLDDNARRGVLAGATVGVHPSVAPYIALYPRANGQNRGNGVADFIDVQSEPAREDWGTARFDLKPSNNDNFFLRYTIDDADHILQRAGAFTFFPEVDANRQQFVTVEETHIFSPTTLNTLRLGINRQTSTAFSDDRLPVPKNLFFIPGSPHFGQISIAGLSTFGPDSILPIINAMTGYQFNDDVDLTRGAHSLKAGILLERFAWNNDNIFQADGRWNFTNGLASFLAGGPTGVSLNVEIPGSDTQRGWRETLTGLYIQDDYRWRSNFTWNLGFRYEFTNTIYEVNGKSSHFRDARRDTAIQVGSPFENPSLKNFAPRIGFAWSPGKSGKSAVSGGFGIYYDQILNNHVDTWRYAAPFYGFGQLTNVSALGIFPNAAAAVANSPRTSRIFDFFHMRSPQALRYNFSIQREVTRALGVRVTYVGARGNHLIRQAWHNSPDPTVTPGGRVFFAPDAPRANPNFVELPMRATDGQSFYNGLQVQLNQRMSHDLMFQFNYTFSKTIDDFSSMHGNDFSNGGIGCGSAAKYDAMRTLDRGLACQDRRHVFQFNYAYSVPLGTGHRLLSHGPGAWILGNWQLQGIVSAQTGAPFTISGSGPAVRGFLEFPGGSLDLPAGVSPHPILGGPNRYYDPAPFVNTISPPGVMGNMPRNAAIGPGLLNFDFSLVKRAYLTERLKAELRSEFFNIFNHANFAGPNTVAVVNGRVNPTAGRITNTTTASRQIQFALRLQF